MKNKHQRQVRGRRRRGVAIVAVLGLLAITLGLSYALMRTEAVTYQINSNQLRQGDARHAALAGLAEGLRRIRLSDWEGVGASVSHRLDDHTSYTVTFTTGDPLLTEGRDDYDEYPFRLTILSTGTSSDPAAPSLTTSHQVRAVVRLTPRKRPAAPSGWSDLQSHTVYHWSTQDAIVNWPAHIDGAVRLHGALRLGEHYSCSDEQREAFFRGLEEMRQESGKDWRPFNGPVHLDESAADSDTLMLLQSALGLTTAHVEGSDEPTSHPGAVTEYRLYPGGQTYQPVAIDVEHGTAIANLTLAPDPQTNPLGIFTSSSNLYLYDNVAIKGTVVLTSGADLKVVGRNVTLQGADLFRVDGESQPVQLPVAMVADDFRLDHGAQAAVAGLLMVWDDFEVERGYTSAKLDLRGRVFAHEVQIFERSQWDFSSNSWDSHWAWYELYEITLPNLQFPEYLQSATGQSVRPNLQLAPPAEDVHYHWQDFAQPMYQIGDHDDGLVWELVRWEEV